MLKDSGAKLSSLRVDGGVALSDALLQIQADVSGVQVLRPADVATTAAGAAVAAGIGAGCRKPRGGGSRPSRCTSACAAAPSPREALQASA